MVASQKKSNQPRLYTKGVHLGFRRGLRTQYPHTSLVRIEGVNSKEDVDFYLGKRIAYTYRVNSDKKKGLKTIWGKVCRPHGNSGVVRAKFSKNLPSRSMGATVRVMLYPSRV